MLVCAGFVVVSILMEVEWKKGSKVVGRLDWKKGGGDAWHWKFLGHTHRLCIIYRCSFFVQAFDISCAITGYPTSVPRPSANMCSITQSTEDD